jgi:hypothetical protein
MVLAHHGAMTDEPVAGSRRIAALALPALGVLAAEPLYLLFDTAVVGRLGALALAGLAIGGLILGLVSSESWCWIHWPSRRKHWSVRHSGLAAPHAPDRWRGG